MHCFFAAIAGRIREKIKMDITYKPPPLNGYLSENNQKK